MTREEKLLSMRMVDLIEVAEKLGVKIDKKGSKTKAIEKIIVAETALESTEVAETATVEAVETVEEEVKETVDTEKELTDEQYAQIGKEIAEQAKQKVKTAKEHKPRKKSDIDTVAIVEEAVKALNLEYKRSRDGIGIFENDKRVVDMWRRSSKIRVYMSANNEKYDKLINSGFVENVHDNPSKSSKLNKSFYVDVNNMKDLLTLYADAE